MISGNGQAGIYLGSSSRGNVVEGNLIGTSVTGKGVLANKMAGVSIAGVSNVIGGDVAAGRNVISGNKQDGVFLTTNSTGNVVMGNYIGLDVTGTNVLGNGYNGVTLSAAWSNRVGGAGGRGCGT